MNDVVSTHIDDYKYRPQHAWNQIAHEDKAKYYTDGHMLLKRSLFPRPLKRMLEPLKSDRKRYKRAGDKSMDRVWNGADLGDRVRGTLSNIVETRQDYREDSTITVTNIDWNRTVILDADKVKFIMTRCKDVSFWITTNGKYDSVVIKTGRKKLGVIMPRTA